MTNTNTSAAEAMREACAKYFDRLAEESSAEAAANEQAQDLAYADIARQAAQDYRDHAASIRALPIPSAPAQEAVQPRLTLALPDYEKRRIEIVSDDLIDDERLVCVAITGEQEAPKVALQPGDLKHLRGVFYALKSYARGCQAPGLAETSAEILEHIITRFDAAAPSPEPAAPRTRTGCEYGCTTECKARLHGCPSECPALPWQPSPTAAQAGDAEPATPMPGAWNNEQCRHQVCDEDMPHDPKCRAWQAAQPAPEQVAQGVAEEGSETAAKTHCTCICVCSIHPCHCGYTAAQPKGAQS